MSTPATNSISKSITNTSGVTPTYWLISRVMITPQTMQLTCTLNGYLTVDGHQSGQAACDARDFSLSGAALAGIVAGGGALLAALAAYIVDNDPSFSGGTVN